MGLKAEYVKPFVQAAHRVLKQELGMEPERGELRLENTYYTTKDITVLIGVTGDVEGTVLYGTSENVAKELVHNITGEQRPRFDEICESAVAEIGNMISGHAGALFEELGLSFNITPPNLILNRGTLIANAATKRLIIPIKLGFGEIEIAVSLRETKPR